MGKIVDSRQTHEISICLVMLFSYFPFIANNYPGLDNFHPVGWEKNCFTQWFLIIFPYQMGVSINGGTPNHPKLL